jgi:hypothetical protein
LYLRRKNRNSQSQNICFYNILTKIKEGVRWESGSIGTKNALYNNNLKIHPIYQWNKNQSFKMVKNTCFKINSKNIQVKMKHILLHNDKSILQSKLCLKYRTKGMYFSENN